MADVFDDVFDTVGDEFEEFMAGLKPVTVRQVNAQTGAATTTAENVPALKRSRRRNPLGVALGGEVGSDTSRFILKAAAVGFYPKSRDEIVDADSVVWVVEQAEAIAFSQLYACDVKLKRS